MAPALLRLAAVEPADLELISAALQDSVAKVKDLTFLKGKRRFTAQLNRYRWEAADAGDRGQRVRAVLSVEGVLSVQARAVRRDAAEAVAAVLALRFEPAAEPPGGVIVLELAGGGALRLEVECVDALLADISEPWTARARPNHEGAA